MRTLADGVRMVMTAQQSMRLAGVRYTAVFISASGMSTGGRVLHHLKALAPEARRTGVFAGFQLGDQPRAQAGGRRARGQDPRRTGAGARRGAAARGLLGPCRPAGTDGLTAIHPQAAGADLRGARRAGCVGQAARRHPEAAGLTGAGAGVPGVRRGLTGQRPHQARTRHKRGPNVARTGPAPGVQPLRRTRPAAAIWWRPTSLPP